jgi:hypothetical protein
MLSANSTTPRHIREQLELLQVERRHYSSRLSVLANQPGHRDEINGYIHLIENINTACISLARAPAHRELRR